MSIIAGTGDRGRASSSRLRRQKLFGTVVLLFCGSSGWSKCRRPGLAGRLATGCWRLVGRVFSCSGVRPPGRGEFAREVALEDGAERGPPWRWYGDEARGRVGERGPVSRVLLLSMLYTLDRLSGMEKYDGRSKRKDAAGLMVSVWKRSSPNSFVSIIIEPDEKLGSLAVCIWGGCWWV